MSKRGDKTQAAPSFLNLHVTGRSSRAVINFVERISLGKLRTHDRQRQILVETRFIDIAERHDLDYRQSHAAAVRPFEQACDLTLVHAFERYGIDLYSQASGLCGLDAVEDLPEIAPACDRPEFFWVKRIE